MRSSFIAHPGARRDCSHCRGGGYVVERKGAHATARLCDCVRTCPRCGGSGFAHTSSERRAPMVKCTCRVLTDRIDLYNAARLPGRHAFSTRASFDYVGSGNLPLMGTLTGWLNGYQPRQENRGLVFFGKVGRGKTHLMCALARELVFEQGVSVRFVEFSHLLTDLKASFQRREGSSELMEPLVRAEVLCIDELGKGRNTEFEGTVVDELVSRRYNANATILATTNYAPGRATGHRVPDMALPDQNRPALADRVGDRVYSRLREMCDFAECRGPDWRERQG